MDVKNVDFESLGKWAAAETARFMAALTNEDVALITALANDAELNADLDRRERELFGDDENRPLTEEEGIIIFESPELSHAEKVAAVRSIRAGVSAS